MLDATRRFEFADQSPRAIREAIKTVADALEEKGYDTVNQIVGYLLTGDPAYITGHQGARNLIQRFEREDVLDEIVRSYLDA